MSMVFDRLRYPDAHVCVIGLGYVGLPLAVSLAELGFIVHGVELRENVIAQLHRGESHIDEPGLARSLARVLDTGNLTLNRHIKDGSDIVVYIITVGTPLGENGRANFSMIEGVASELAESLVAGNMVILRSTVRIGVTRQSVKPILDRAGVPYDLAFCPERTIEGKAMGELRSLPQIVGAFDHHSLVRAAQFFQFLTPTVIRVSSLETAEMVKLVDNTQRDVWFGYANEIARVCDQLGISAGEVIDAGNLGYARSQVAHPGPVGGPCLSKDPYILDEIAAETGHALDLIRAARRVNETEPQRITDFLAGLARRLDGFASPPILAMLGIAFKGQPATGDVRGTMVVPLLEALREAFPGLKARGFDAVADRASITKLGFTSVRDPIEAAKGANIVILANRHLVIESLDLVELAAAMAHPGIIYDLWSRFRDPPSLEPSILYCGAGDHWRAERRPV